MKNAGHVNIISQSTVNGIICLLRVVMIHLINHIHIVINKKVRRMPMDPWEMFSEMCRRVVTEQNVYLDVMITPTIIEMELLPYDKEDWDDTQTD